MPGIMPRKFGKKQQQDAAGEIPAGFIVLPDGNVVRGAKKGGITDHIAGPHLIPNCGREAMVPAECVRRQRPAPKKKPLEPPKPTFDLKELKASRSNRNTEAARKAVKHQKEPTARSRSRHRSRDRSTRGRGGGSEPSRSRSQSAGGQSDESPARQHVKSTEQWEDELRQQAQQEAERKDREAQRLAEERKKIEELEQARKRKEDQDKQRRHKLSGMFALNADDMDDDDSTQVEKAKLTRERQLAADRREARSLSALPPTSSNTVIAQPTTSGGSAVPRLNTKDSVTALDIDGAGHDHKFSRVWKDWDASKKDDPGEIARQFMKVSAIKRRGYGGGAAGSRGARDRSRSRGR